jgi:hypothetical protein
VNQLILIICICGVQCDDSIQVHIVIDQIRVITTRGLDYEHMIKARAHKGGVRIGKTPKKLASVCCP